MHYTSGYNLPQYEEEDVTSWIGVFNDAMRKIDSAITAALVTTESNNQVGYNKLLEIQNTINEMGTTISERIDFVSQEIKNLEGDLDWVQEDLQGKINTNADNITTLFNDAADTYQQFKDFKDNIATAQIDADGQGRSIRDAFLKAYQDTGFGDRELRQSIENLTVSSNEKFTQHSNTLSTHSSLLTSTTATANSALEKSNTAIARLNKNQTLMSNYSPGGSNAKTVKYTLKVMDGLTLFHVYGDVTVNANTTMTSPDSGILITSINGNQMGMTANETMDFGWIHLVKALDGKHYFVPAHVKCVYQDSKTKFYITGGANFETGLFMDFTLFSVIDNVVWG